MASEKEVAAFLRVFDCCGHAFRLSDVRRNKVEADYKLARRAGFFQDAGIETTVAAEDALGKRRSGSHGER